MFQLVHTFELITGPLGRLYRPRAYGQPQANGLWDGWLVFFPTNAGSVVATERATTRDSIEALIDWAAALSLDYLQLGLERALELQPDAPVAAELQRLQRLETQALDQADTLEQAAVVARRAAIVAGERRAHAAADLAHAEAADATTSAGVHELSASIDRAEAELHEQKAAEYERAADAVVEAHASEAGLCICCVGRPGVNSRPQPTQGRAPEIARLLSARTSLVRWADGLLRRDAAASGRVEAVRPPFMRPPRRGQSGWQGPSVVAVAGPRTKRVQGLPEILEALFRFSVPATIQRHAV